MNHIKADQPANDAQMAALIKSQLNIAGAATVEIMTSAKGNVWVNVNSVCVLRISDIKHLALDGETVRAPTEREAVTIKKIVGV